MNTASRRAASDASSRKSPIRMATSKFSPTRSTKRADRSTSSAMAGCASDELREQGCEDQVGHVGRHRDPQSPAGLDLPILGQRSRRFDLVDDVMRVLEHAVAEVGDGELAGGAQQQALAELRFQCRHAPGNRRLGEAQALGRAAEAALVHHPGEQEEIVGFESWSPWHCPDGATMLSIFTPSAPLAQQLYSLHHQPTPMERTMNILQINSSAKSEGSQSTRLASKLVERLRDANQRRDADGPRPVAHPAPGAGRGDAAGAVHAGRTTHAGTGGARGAGRRY